MHFWGRFRRLLGSDIRNNEWLHRCNVTLFHHVPFTHSTHMQCPRRAEQRPSFRRLNLDKAMEVTCVR